VRADQRRAKPRAHKLYQGVSITLLSRIEENSIKLHAAPTAKAGGSQQPRLDLAEHLFPRHTRSFLGTDVASQDEEVGQGGQHQVMMKTAPRPAFKVVQPQVVLGALQILFDRPAGTTQPQTASPAGRLMPVGQGVVIRLGLVGGPVERADFAD